MPRLRITIAVMLIAALVAAITYLLADYLALLALRNGLRHHPHASIEVIAYDSEGRRLGSAGFFDTWFPNLIVRDHTGAAGFGYQYGVSGPRIAIPPGEPVSLELLWPVPGFGKVLLEADNRGRGYRVSAGAFTRIELGPELARTRLQQLERWIADHNQGRAATEAIADAVAQARSLVVALDANGDPRQRAALAAAALRIAIRASENEVVAEAQNFIREHRRGSLDIKLIDQTGAPVPGASIRALEVEPEFLFGAFNYGYDAATIARLKSAGLNYATLHMNWLQMEPKPGKFAFAKFDRIFNPAALKENGFKLRGHALVWFRAHPVAWLLDPNQSDVTPSYLNQFRGRPTELNVIARKHVAEIVNHYKDLVDIWEASNEGHAEWASFELTPADMTQVVKAAAEEIRRDAPGTPIMVNVGLPLGENVPWSYYPMVPLLERGLVGRFSIDPYNYLKLLDRAAVPYDLVGLEFYYGGKIQGSLDCPSIDLFRFARALDRYSQFGKPLQVTEICVGSSGFNKMHSWWHAPADQITQADYLAGTFTIAYGNPHVQGITWWDMYDRRAAQRDSDSWQRNSFIASGGLIDSAGHPKLAYQRLASLLEGWRSRGEATTDDNGAATLTGAPGEYQLTAASGAATVTGNAHIHENRSEVVVMSLNIAQTPSRRRRAVPRAGEQENPAPDQENAPEQ